jgi:hypothetical protein
MLHVASAILLSEKARGELYSRYGATAFIADANMAAESRSRNPIKEKGKKKKRKEKLLSYRILPLRSSR